MTVESICDRVTSETLSPVPFALGVDIFSAGQALEVATYATDPAVVVDALDVAAGWIRMAQQRAGDVDDDAFALRAACVATTLETWASQVPTDPTDLAMFQQTQLAPYQGVLSRLGISADIATHDYAGGGLAFLGVLGALAAVIVAEEFIDWKQTHGGYDRGPKATRTPIVSTEYR